MKITVIDDEIPKEEVDTYIENLKKKHPDKIFKSVTLTLDGNDVLIEYEYDSKPIHRIRRITGYLVGDLGRFNNAKLAEVRDRVKHRVGSRTIAKI